MGRKLMQAVFALVALGLIASSLGVFSSLQPHARADTSTGTWQVVPSPNGSADGNQLRSVAVISSNDVWAVGNYPASGHAQTLAEHWDGTQWSIVPTPTPNFGSTDSILSGVAGCSSNDVWAVGSAKTSRFSLIEHWDGSQWSLVDHPHTGDGYVFEDFNGIAVINCSDVWAVGETNNQTVTQHWNGSSWSIVPSPNALNWDTLYAVSAASSSDVWAVGVARTWGAPDQLVEHWDGTKWSIINTPSLPDGRVGVINGVKVIASDDVWIVGDSSIPDGGSGHSYETLTEHWDGTQWSVIPCQTADSQTWLTLLEGVAAFSSTDVWAVGAITESGSTEQTVIKHWDGTQWSSVTAPSVSNGSNLRAISIAQGSAWAVGESLSNTSNTLVEQYTTSTPTPSPTPQPPTGKWLSPSNGFTTKQGSNVTLGILADPASGGLPVKQVNINAWWKGVDPKNWTPIATVTTPDSGTTDHYTYKWNFKVGGSYLPETPVEFSFDVVDQAGNTVDRPNGVREGMFVPKTTPNPTGPYVTLTVTPQALATNPTVCVDNLTFSVKNTTADEIRVSDNGTFQTKLSGSATTYSSSPLGWGYTGYDLYEVMALQNGHFLALTRTQVTYVGTACADGFKAPSAPLPPLPDSQNDLFVIAGGINTSLPNDAQDALGGNGYGYNASIEGYGTVGGNLVWQGYRDSHIIVYSYTGDTGDGAPGAYGCQDTWHNALQDDAKKLGQQIVDAVAGDPNIRVHLIVHSLAGAVVHEYVAAMLYGLYSVPTIPWSQLKDITILDSPFGGMTNNSAYLGWLVTVEHFICSGYSPANSYAQLEQQMQSATDQKHLGATAKHFTLDLGGSSSIPNQQIADDAHAKGVTFNVIGNLRDYLVQPQGCGGGPNFLSTMFDIDRGDGSAEFSRVFSSGQTSCSSSALNNGLNHGDVLHNSNVNKWVAQIIMGVPVPVGLSSYTG
jgi:hypothetical protein